MTNNNAHQFIQWVPAISLYLSDDQRVNEEKKIEDENKNDQQKEKKYKVKCYKRKWKKQKRLTFIVSVVIVEQQFTSYALSSFCRMNEIVFFIFFFFHFKYIRSVYLLLCIIHHLKLLSISFYFLLYSVSFPCFHLLFLNEKRMNEWTVDTLNEWMNAWMVDRWNDVYKGKCTNKMHEWIEKKTLFSFFFFRVQEEEEEKNNSDWIKEEKKKEFFSHWVCAMKLRHFYVCFFFRKKWKL